MYLKSIFHNNVKKGAGTAGLILGLFRDHYSVWFEINFSGSFDGVQSQKALSVSHSQQCTILIHVIAPTWKLNWFPGYLVHIITKLDCYSTQCT